jgi:hypothetical protein
VRCWHAFQFVPLLGPLRSLPVEVEMYVLLPVMFMLLGPTRSPRIALCLWVLATLVAWMQAAFSERLTVINFAPCFIAGIVAYTLSGWSPKRLPAQLWIPLSLSLHRPVGGLHGADRFAGTVAMVGSRGSYGCHVGRQLPFSGEACHRPRRATRREMG